MTTTITTTVHDNARLIARDAIVAGHADLVTRAAEHLVRGDAIGQLAVDGLRANFLDLYELARALNYGHSVEVPGQPGGMIDIEETWDAMLRRAIERVTPPAAEQAAPTAAQQAEGEAMMAEIFGGTR